MKSGILCKIGPLNHHNFGIKSDWTILTAPLIFSLKTTKGLKKKQKKRYPFSKLDLYKKKN